MFSIVSLVSSSSTAESEMKREQQILAINDDAIDLTISIAVYHAQLNDYPSPHRNGSATMAYSFQAPSQQHTTHILHGLKNSNRLYGMRYTR